MRRPELLFLKVLSPYYSYLSLILTCIVGSGDPRTHLQNSLGFRHRLLALSVSWLSPNGHKPTAGPLPHAADWSGLEAFREDLAEEVR